MALPQYSFGAGQLFAVPSGGNTPVRFGAVQGVSITFSFQQKNVHGRKQFPIGIYRGVGKMTGRAEFAHIDGAVFNQIMFGGSTPTVGNRRAIFNEAHTITGNTVTANMGANFSADLGVVRADNGDIFERAVEGLDGPRGQQYTCNETTGVYSFQPDPDCNCVSANVAISYLYTDTTSGSNVPIVNRDQGLAPQFMMVLKETFNGQAMTVVLNVCQASRLNMKFEQNDFMMPALDFVFGSDANGDVGSISLEGAPPCEFHETFLSLLNGYRVVPGFDDNPGTYSIVETEYGHSLNAASEASGFDRIAKVIGGILVRIFKVRFRMTALELDDAAFVMLTTGAGTTSPFQFTPRREISFSPLQTAVVFFAGTNWGVTDAALDADEWYELVVEFDPVVNAQSVVTRLSDNTIIKTTDFGQVIPPFFVTHLVFRTDTGFPSTPTQYDEIMVC